MEEVIISNIKTKMVYDKSKSPKDNLNIFFGAVKTLRFELVIKKIGKRQVAHLHSAWKNDVELKEIISRFAENFTDHMFQSSTAEVGSDTYGSELLECKRLLLKINRHYSPSFTGAMVMCDGELVSLDSLSARQYEMILRCYDLFALTAKDLMAFVQQEEQEFKWREYQRSNSLYNWAIDKKDFSELAMAIWASGAINIKGTGKLMPSTFARELGAFFGINKMRFDQDIDDIASRNGRRKAGDFILKCNERLLKVIEERKALKKNK